MIVKLFAFVDPGAKQTLLGLVTAPPVLLEKERQQASLVLQSLLSTQIAPSAIIPPMLTPVFYMPLSSHSMSFFPASILKKVSATFLI